jgi:excisionase family DNA binding protein
MSAGELNAFETSGTSPTETAYLTVPEVARLLRVSVATVYRLVQADPTLPVLRLPGVMRFPRERLLRWLRDREQGQGRPRGMLNQVLSSAKSASLQEVGHA